jgi:nucleotide-binding universal stress UspA family protein
VSEHPVIACYRGLDSADAVGLGALLAGALGEPLVLASAYRYEPAALSARPLPDPDNARRAHAAATALRRARQFAGPAVAVREEIVPAARIVDALLELASDSDACMLVLGRDTRGHVTRSLLSHAPCPVAVAPLSVPRPRLDPPRRIGVAIDDSDPAACALAAATGLARATRAELELLCVGPTREHAAARLAAARRSLDCAGVDHTLSPLVGEPRAALTEASRQLDLLVCGSRGRGRPVAALLGSVSAHLAAHAGCPVLVVPQTVARSDGGALGVTSAAANG